MLKARQRMAEILRILPGSSLVVAPSDTDLADPRSAAGLEESFGGGGYTARQRAALLQLAAGPCRLGARRPRVRLRAARQRRHRRVARPPAPRFDRYNELANGVLQALSVEMPVIDLNSLRAAPLPQRRPVTPPSSRARRAHETLAASTHRRARARPAAGRPRRPRRRRARRHAHLGAARHARRALARSRPTPRPSSRRSWCCTPSTTRW